VQPTERPQQPVVVATEAPAAQTWNCSGDVYNCGDFPNRSELMSYFNTCPGDPSDLDGNADGIPCESLR
jgi:hypothetical protein